MVSVLFFFLVSVSNVPASSSIDVRVHFVVIPNHIIICIEQKCVRFYELCVSLYVCPSVRPCVFGSTISSKRYYFSNLISTAFDALYLPSFVRHPNQWPMLRQYSPISFVIRILPKREYVFRTRTVWKVRAERAPAWCQERTIFIYHLLKIPSKFRNTTRPPLFFLSRAPFVIEWNKKKK